MQVTPGALIHETVALLSNPVFKMGRAEMLEVLESVYTRRPDNARWEFMRARTVRNALSLNDRVRWLPEKFKNNLDDTLRYNPDRGLPYARKASLDFRTSQG